MKIFIVYAHPGGDNEDSFVIHAKNSFIDGLKEANHEYIISDLYKMNFVSDMSEAEYFRESNMSTDLPVPPDVLAEQEKINSCDAIVFIFPVFWADVPAKLKGWFDRVWTYGFAYGENRKMKTLEKGLVLCIAGNPIAQLKETGQYDSLKITMLNDRLHDRAKIKELVILDGTSKFNPTLRKCNWETHLKTAFYAAINL
jgi:NAD(P)H dehydrogenase (quinone)